MDNPMKEGIMAHKPYRDALDRRDAAIAREYRAGASLAALADAANLSRERVRQILRARGITPRAPGRPRKDQGET